MTASANLRAALAAILLTTAGFAVAHTGADGGAHHGFSAGLAHPFTGLDHLLAILAVGFWAASIGRRGRAIAVAFPAAMLAGALLTAAGFVPPAVEPMVAASLLIIGLLVAARTRFVAPTAAAPAAAAPAAIALVAVFAVFHGAAHVGETTGGAAALTGMLAGTVLLLGIGALFGAASRTRSAWWPRAAGAAASLTGAALLLPMLQG